MRFLRPTRPLQTGPCPKSSRLQRFILNVNLTSSSRRVLAPGRWAGRGSGFHTPNQHRPVSPNALGVALLKRKLGAKRFGEIDGWGIICDPFPVPLSLAVVAVSSREDGFRNPWGTSSQR
eukprot:2288097-Pyramimonas_sp.AAC.1